MDRDFKNDIKSYINKELEILKSIDIDAVNKAMNTLEDARRKGARIYVFGNGGSAATASHMQNDFNKGISEHLKNKYDFVCLNDNIATIMAIANDDSFENVFLNQLENRLKENDVVIAISGSGNSENIIRAVLYAKKMGNTVIGFSGYSGGKLKQLADISLHAPVDNMQIAEDMHVIYNHLMMYILCNVIKEK